MEYLDHCLCLGVHGNKGQGMDLSRDQVGSYYNVQICVGTMCLKTVKAQTCISAKLYC